MKINSENLISEKSLIKKTIIVVLSVIFAAIAIPAYVIYQLVNPKNSIEFRKLVSKSLLLTCLYSAIFLVVLFMLGFAQDGNGENYTLYVKIASFVIFYYLIIHLLLFFYAIVKRNIQILRKLSWFPAIILLISFTILLMNP